MFFIFQLAMIDIVCEFFGHEKLLVSLVTCDDLVVNICESVVTTNKKCLGTGKFRSSSTWRDVLAEWISPASTGPPCTKTSGSSAKVCLAATPLPKVLFLQSHYWLKYIRIFDISNYCG